MAEHVIDGVASGAEFGRIGLGNDNGAVGLETLHQNVGTLGNTIRKDARSLGPTHARDRGEILDDDRKPIQEALRWFWGAAAHEISRMRASPIEASNGKGVELGLDFGDAALGGVDQFKRRYFAPAQEFDGAARTEAVKLIGHSRSSQRRTAGGLIDKSRSTHHPMLAICRLSTCEGSARATGDHNGQQTL